MGTTSRTTKDKRTSGKGKKEMKQRTNMGDVDSLILKFAHIYEKHIYKQQMKIRDRIRTEKNLFIKAQLIERDKILTLLTKSLLNAIDEFRTDGVNSKNLYPKVKKEK